jgi:hypothetical protein
MLLLCFPLTNCLFYTIARWSVSKTDADAYQSGTDLYLCAPYALYILKLPVCSACM